MARISIKIPKAEFAFEATGPEHQITKWYDEALKMKFGKDIFLTGPERAVDRSWELNHDNGICLNTPKKLQDP